MTDMISVTGIIATEPKHIVTSSGRPITSFRLASAQRRFDATRQSWTDSSTNWYSVSIFAGLAVHAAESLGRGDRVILRGRLRIRDWEKDGRSGTTADIVAESIGHDLLWGTTTYTRSPRWDGAGELPEGEGTWLSDVEAPVGTAT